MCICDSTAVLVSMFVPPKHPRARPTATPVAVWEMVSGQVPFAGLHHGEVIHRVVTEDLRPGKGLSYMGCQGCQSMACTVCAAQTPALWHCCCNTMALSIQADSCQQ
jgi:hypothetical protein